METEILCGTIYQVSEKDYSLSDLLYGGKLFRRHNGPRAVYNQLNLSPYACFFAAPFAACADAYPLTSEDKKKARQVAEDTWKELVAAGDFYEGKGGYLVKGVDWARRGWNKAFPDKQVATYRTSAASNDLFRITFLGYAPVTGYYASKEKVADVLDDGIVQGDAKDAGAYGHLVRMESGYRIIDNYPTRGTLAVAGRNKYFMDDFDLKVKNGLMFPSIYVALPKSI
jgi:hypothetical protein